MMKFINQNLINLLIIYKMKIIINQFFNNNKLIKKIHKLNNKFKIFNKKKI